MLLDLSRAGTTAYAKQISTASLGDHSYIVVVDDQAVAIDIQRDLARFEEVLSGIDARLIAVFETHIHNDYVSGGKRLAELHDAAYILPANTDAPYDHTPLADGLTVDVGGWLIRAMHTPGHTYNHTSFVLEAPDGPVAIFSGGSMLVGAVGRSDLLGPDHTEALLAGQYGSMHRIAERLDDPSIVAPTHGSGSFCSASDVADSTSTIEQEKLRNPALTASSLESFAISQQAGYKQFPLYYQYMGPTNLKSMEAPPAEPLAAVSSLEDTASAVLVDVRPFVEYAAGHIPGSLSFEMSNDDAVYMGWTMEWGTPVVLIGSVEAAQEVRVHLQRIGWDDVVGRIDPSILSELSNDPLTTTEIATFSELGLPITSALLDVRDPIEHMDGAIPGAALAHLADVGADPDRFIDGEPIVVYCASGNRAGIAAGLLEAAGGSAVVVRDDLSNYKGLLATPAL
jgi:hydroxyacylglutathione hydrolase